MPRTEWTGETTYAKKIEALCEGLVTSERLLGPWPACAPAPAPSPPPEAGPVHGAATSGAPAAAAAGRRDRAFASFSEFQRREAAKSHAEDEGSLPPAPRVVTEGDRGPRETRRRLSRWEE